MHFNSFRLCICFVLATLTNVIGEYYTKATYSSRTAQEGAGFSENKTPESYFNICNKCLTYSINLYKRKVFYSTDLTNLIEKAVKSVTNFFYLKYAINLDTSLLGDVSPTINRSNLRSRLTPV